MNWAAFWTVWAAVGGIVGAAWFMIWLMEEFGKVPGGMAGIFAVTIIMSVVCGWVARR